MEVIELEIVLVRHGETDWNREQVFRGRADAELNANGVEQAQFLAQRWSDREITAIYSSPLKRALDTAGIIAGHNDAHHLNQVGKERLRIDF